MATKNKFKAKNNSFKTTNKSTTKWNEKKERFCQLYDLYNNGARAAREAGYSEDIASSRTIACTLLRDPLVQKRILELREDWHERIGITKERILEELADIAYSNIHYFTRWNDSGVTLADSDQVPERLKRAVKEVTYRYSDGAGTVSLKLHDKISALEKLGRHLGLFKDVVEHQGKLTLEDLVAGAGENDGKGSD